MENDLDIYVRLAWQVLILLVVIGAVGFASYVLFKKYRAKYPTQNTHPKPQEKSDIKIKKKYRNVIIDDEKAEKILEDLDKNKKVELPIEQALYMMRTWDKRFQTTNDGTIMVEAERPADEKFIQAKGGSRIVRHKDEVIEVDVSDEPQNENEDKQQENSITTNQVIEVAPQQEKQNIFFKDEQSKQESEQEITPSEVIDDDFVKPGTIIEDTGTYKVTALENNHIKIETMQWYKILNQNTGKIVESVVYNENENEIDIKQPQKQNEQDKKEVVADVQVEEKKVEVDDFNPHAETFEERHFGRVIEDGGHFQTIVHDKDHIKRITSNGYTIINKATQKVIESVNYENQKKEEEEKSKKDNSKPQPQNKKPQGFSISPKQLIAAVKLIEKGTSKSEVFNVLGIYDDQSKEEMIKMLDEAFDKDDEEQSRSIPKEQAKQETIQPTQTQPIVQQQESKPQEQKTETVLAPQKTSNQEQADEFPFLTSSNPIKDLANAMKSQPPKPKQQKPKREKFFFENSYEDIHSIENFFNDSNFQNNLVEFLVWTEKNCRNVFTDENFLYISLGDFLCAISSTVKAEQKEQFISSLFSGKEEFDGLEKFCGKLQANINLHLEAKLFLSFQSKFVYSKGIETQDQKTLSGKFLVVNLRKDIGAEFANKQDRTKRLCKVVANNEQEILDNLTATQIKIPKQSEVAKWL